MTSVSIPPTPAGSDSDWRAILKSAIRNPADLCRILRLPADLAESAARAAGGFPLLAPLPYVERMEPGNPRDPLLRQVMPLEDEQRETPQFTADPVGDAAAKRLPNLLQKYHGRALMITTGVCAVHCRYCFRRHYPFDQKAASPRRWDSAVREIARERSIGEVILSGGDPLTSVDADLADLVSELESLPQLRRLRIHTRLPIMIPQRVTGELIRVLRTSRLLPIVVVQSNHPQELDGAVESALTRLAEAGIQVLNQTVLLSGVNDDLETLTGLSSRLLECRVMPYYLHQLDRVAGAAHFEVPLDEGLRLIREMRALLPGYAVPRYVREDPGAPSKTILA
jgi:EF-P beta-lysylation protein EpmB